MTPETERLRDMGAEENGPNTNTNTIMNTIFIAGTVVMAVILLGTIARTIPRD